MAQEIVYYWDGGAFTEYGANIARAAGYSSVGPYDVDNVWQILFVFIPTIQWVGPIGVLNV